MGTNLEVKNRKITRKSPNIWNLWRRFENKTTAKKKERERESAREKERKPTSHHFSLKKKYVKKKEKICKKEICI